jgi:hypothetical protein
MRGRRGAAAAAAVAAAAALAARGGARAGQVECRVRVEPGPEQDGSGCQRTTWEVEGRALGFHACPNKQGMEGVQKRLAAGEKNPLPDGDNRVLQGWSLEESGNPQWSAVTFDESGGVTGGMVRDTKSTLLQVERTKGGQMLCELNPDDIKLPGVDIAVKPGPGGKIDHIHGDGTPHNHDEGKDREWIKKAVNGRKLAKAYPECPRWSTLAVEIIAELDREFINVNGGLVPARAAAADIMNLVAANYESQIGVELKPRYYVKRGLAGSIGHQYTNTNANALLDEFRARWESGSLAAMRRGAVHLLTGKNIDGSVIGIAYVDVMCDSISGDAWNGEYEYGISQVTQSSLGCNVGLVMHELGHNAGSNHVSGAVMNPSLTCSNTFSASAISQIENHMDGHVPNDGTPDGCWCERMWIIRDLPWWWPFPFRYWGPFAPAEVPQDPRPIDPIGPIDPIDPRLPRPIPPLPERSVSEAGVDACLGVARRRRCNKVAGCQWEGPRKANKGGRCVASGVSTATSTATHCNGLRRRRCRKTAGCDFDRAYKQCLPTGDVAQAMSAAGVDMCHNLRPRRCRRAPNCRLDRPTRTCVPR